MMKNIAALVLAVFGLAGGAWAQGRVAGDVSTGELTLKFRWIFRDGETTTRRVSQQSIPNVPPLSTVFAPLGGRTYVVRSTAIGSDAVVTLSGVPGTQKEFKSIRILELQKNELFPSGYEWRDCTILPRSIEDLKPSVEPHVIERVEAHNLAMAKYFPDFSSRRAACSPQMYKGSSVDLYLVAVLQTEAAPTSPFTEIKLKLESSEKRGEVGRRYVVSVSNTGKTDAMEINLRSHFATEVDQISVHASQGNCASSSFGYRTFVCHLGRLAVGNTATIELLASPRPPGDPNYRDISDGPWLIEGYAKEHPTDPHWAANRFELEPLKDQGPRN